MASQLSDHATLLLSLHAATHPLPRPDTTPGPGAPPQPRQFHPGTAEQVAAAANELRADEQQLAALEAAAEAAGTVEELERTAFVQLTLAAMERAGLKPQQPRGGRQTRQTRTLPRHLQAQYGIPASQTPDARHARRRRQHTAGAGCHRERPQPPAAAAAGGTQAFFLRYRSRSSQLALSSLQPEEVSQHFQQLLGHMAAGPGDPPAPDPAPAQTPPTRPPPEPPQPIRPPPEPPPPEPTPPSPPPHPRPTPPRPGLPGGGEGGVGDSQLVGGCECLVHEAGGGSERPAVFQSLAARRSQRRHRGASPVSGSATALGAACRTPSSPCRKPICSFSAALPAEPSGPAAALASSCSPHTSRPLTQICAVGEH